MNAQLDKLDEAGNCRLVLEIGLVAKPPLSKSGKTRLAFTTGSFLKLPLYHPTYGQISVAVNVIVPVDPKPTSLA